MIHYRNHLLNLKLVCEWMHRKRSGNSSVFVWATPNSIGRLSGGQGRLPQGIKVEVIDLGHAELYEINHQKPSEWFTSYGDVFPVGGVRMTPFPPVAPKEK